VSFEFGIGIRVSRDRSISISFISLLANGAAE